MISLSDTIPFEPQPLSDRVWSDYQVAFFDAVKGGSANILLQAVAGSGKTTTIIEGMNHAGGNPLFMAFNKAIAEDIRRKVYFGTVKTLNALGHGLMMQMRPKAKLDARKTLTHLERLMGAGDDFKEYGYTLSRAIGLAKNNAISPDMDAALSIMEIIEAYDLLIPADRLEHLSRVAAQALVEGHADQGVFDFDDQLYVPVMGGWAFPVYSDVFVDETQDLTTIQHCMLSALAARGARIMCVGDRHQSIYGFRGALHDSMDQLRRQFNMLELPLSISYRCPTSVIAEAQVYCPTIQARPGAYPGEVHFSTVDPDIFPRAMIICRNNAPLFRAILKHIRAQVPCKVMSNFLDQFHGFIKSLKAHDMTNLRMKLDRWYEREHKAAEDKGMRGRAFGITDKYTTVRMLAEQYSSVDDMLIAVKRLGEGGPELPVFSTVHKAKGLEHDSVHILRPDLIPAFYATTPEQKQQENNLLYVAITRSKDKLTYGEMPK